MGWMTGVQFLATMLRPGWRPTQPPIQWLLGDTYPRDKATRL